MFRVGQKVTMKPEMGNEWTKNVSGVRHSGPPSPVVGEVYTVTELDTSGDGEYLYLADVDGSYWAERFRPVTSIAVFERLLMSAPIPQDEQV